MKNALIRFFLPPAYAVVIMLTPSIIKAPGELWGITMFMLFAYVYGLAVVGVPAAGFAWVMGRLERRGFRHGGVRLLAAALLGLIAGGLLTIPFGLQGAEVFMPLGLVVGPLVELTVILTENRHPTIRHR